MADRHIYKIENKEGRPTGFRVRGGIEVVKPGQTRTLELTGPLDETAIKQFEQAGISVAEAEDEPENKVSSKPARPQVTPAKNPAETGGVVPRSEVSEEGGVKRAAGDTTTTTKPTEKQTGAKA